jgi:predicted transcriptional regulator
MFKLIDTGGSGRGVKVTCDRMKDAEPPEPTTLHPQLVSLPDLGQGVSSLVTGWASSPPSSPPLASKADEASYEASGVQRKHLRALKEASKEASRGIGSAAVAEALRVTRNNLGRTIKPLVDVGFIEVSGATTNRRYTVTAKGLEALR